MFVNYVDIVSKDVFDRHNRLIGRPYDFLVRLGYAYPQMISMVISRGVFSKEYTVIPWGNIKKFDEAIHLNVSEETLNFKADYKDETLTSVRFGILDQQVVDIFNRKVIRVNDIHILKMDKDLRIAHVEVGFRALVRRLGWQRIIDKLVRIFNSRSRYLTREILIAWKFVQPLEVLPKKGTIRLDVSNEDLKAIPPADFSEIMEELDPPERIALFRSLDFETQVDVLNELEIDMQIDLIEELDSEVAIKLIEEMDPDEVVDLLGELPDKESERILSLVQPVIAKKLKTLLEYESDSAGGFMTTEFANLNPDMTAKEAIERVRDAELDIEMIYYTYVTDSENHLLGVVTLKDLLMAREEDKVGDIMAERPIAVHVNNDVKEAAFLMDKYDLLAIPVVDAQNAIKGMITIDDVLALAIDEAWGEKPGLL